MYKINIQYCTLEYPHHPGVHTAGGSIEDQLRRPEMSEIAEIKFSLGVLAEEKKVVDTEALDAGVAVQLNCAREVLRLKALNRDMLSLRSIMGKSTA
jgi:hypothetical protein